MPYCCPEPTQEQVILAAKLGFDAKDRCGDGLTDTSPCDVLCAACLIHDELFLLGGTIEKFHLANSNFARDCIILAEAVDDIFLRIETMSRALLYLTFITGVSWQFWHFKDRNNDITRAQGEAFMVEAKIWINECAIKTKNPLPYPEVL